jgi:signal transduction histidine kinase
LNYLGNELIGNLNRHSSDSAGEFMMVNASGYWLKGLEPGEEWGFMFDDRKKLTQVRRDPEAWRIISTRDEGQFRNDQGLYTYATICPLNRNMLSSTGSSQAFTPSAGERSGREMHWKIISLVSEKTLQGHSQMLLLKKLPAGSLEALLIVAVAMAFSVITVQRKRAAEERLYLEKLQAILELAGGVCHELSQPMQAISGYCELLMINRKDDNPHSGMIKKMKAQIERMGGITNQLTRITKYETTDYLGGKIVDIEKSSLPSSDTNEDVKK